MNKKAPRYAAIIFLIGTLLANLTGCATPEHYGRSDIKEYVEENIGLDKFSVSRSYKKAKDLDPRMVDKIWTVTDKKSGLEFHVVDYRYPEGEYSFGVTNKLIDDYSQQVIAQFSDKLPELPGFDYSQMEESDKSYGYLTEYGFLNGTLHTSFRTKSDLVNVQNSLEELRSAIDDLGIPRPENLETLLAQENEYTDGVTDMSEYINIWDDFDYEHLMEDYVRSLFEYRCDEEAINDIPHDEAVKYLTSETFMSGGLWIDFVGVYHNGTDKPADYYDDIIYMSRGTRNLSFGSIYEVMKREGLKVEGTPVHFKFKGIDGSEYEMSFDYYDLEPSKSTSEEYKRWYYMKDGEKVPLSSPFYFGLHSDTIEEMTGIQFIDYDTIEARREERKAN